MVAGWWDDGAMPSKPGRRIYSEAEKSEAVVASKELGIEVMSDRLGVTTRTLTRWRESAQAAHIDAVKAAPPVGIVADSLTYRERMPLLANRLGAMAQLALEHVPEHLEAGQPGKAQQAMTTAAIAIDKAQLLSGNATSRTEHGSTPAELDARLLELGATLKAQYEAMRAGRVAGAVDAESDPA